MILVLFHILYLFGKYVYDSYHIKKRKIPGDRAGSVEMPRVISEEIYNMIDAEQTTDYADKKAIRFSPPVYIQRYTTVSDILLSDKYKGKIRKVVDFGCAELSFFTYLKNVEGVEEILCVDIDRSCLEANKNKVEPLTYEYLYCRAKPLTVHVYEGSVTGNDRRLKKTDAVICIELIEHLYPDTLTDFPFNIFGYIKPKVAIITTPNADFNILFPLLYKFRHPDHKFEWTREQFQDWAHNIVLRYPDYEVTFHGICNGPQGMEHLGPCTQMAIFHCTSEENESELLGVEGLFKTVVSYEYPFKVDNRSDEQKILDEAVYYIRWLSFQEDLQEELPLEHLLPLLNKFNVTMESLRIILEEAGWAIVDNEIGPNVMIPQQSSFSDYSAIEGNFLDEDRWNVQFEPSENYYDGDTNQQFSFNDAWTSDVWEEEPSIIIPQNNSIMQENNTYLFDAEHELSNVDLLPDETHAHGPSTDLGSNSVLQNTDIRLTIKPHTLSHKNTTKNSYTHNDNNTFITTEGVNRSLDFHHHTSVSCSSISPQPLSIHLDRVNSSYRDDTTIEDKSMTYESSLMNNTFHSLDTLKNEDLEEATASYFIHLNTSLHDEISLKIKNETATMKGENVSYEDHHFNPEEHLFPLDTRKARLQYTSSPRVLTKNKAINFDDKLSRPEENISNNDVLNTSCLVDEPNSCTDNDIVNNYPTSSQHCNNISVSAVSIGNCSMSEKCDLGKNIATLESKESIITKRKDIPIGISDLNNEVTILQDHIIRSQKSNIESVDNINESKRKLPFVKQHSSPSSYQNTTDTSNDENCCYFACAKKNSDSRNNDITLQSEGKENVSDVQFETCLIKVMAERKDYPHSFSQKYNSSPSNIVEVNKHMMVKPNSLEPLDTPPNSWSPEIMDSGYPNSASVQDMTPEYDLSSIAQDQIPESESPSVAEVPQPENLEPIEIENGDLANNNRDGEGNNMVALIDNDMENLQPFIDILENDLENENDIYVVENDFPVWLLRILDMANPIEVEGGNILREHRELLPFVPIADYDEGFSSSSSEGDNNENNDEILNNIMDENHIDNDEVKQDMDSEDDNNVENVFDSVHDSTSNANSDEWILEST